MGIESPVHLIFIGVVALLVLGPKRLPEVARALGHGLREFREMMNMEGQPPIEQQPIVNTTVPDPQMPVAPRGAMGAWAASPASATAPAHAPASVAGAPAHGDPLAEGFVYAEAQRTQVDPAPPVPSPDAPDRRTV